MKLLIIPQAKTIYGVLASLAVMIFTSSSLAVTVEQVPNPREVNNGWVTDMADMLSPATEAQLNQIISQLEAKNGSEIAVVTVPETTASTPKEFATKLFNYWGIGKADKNNGVLFLISQGERRTEIETGSGIQEILPNAKVSDIINTQITPKFKQGDFNSGTIAGTKALVIALETPQATSTVIAPNKPQPVATLPPAIVEQYEDNNFPWWLVGGGGLALAIGVAVRKPRRVDITPEGRSRLHGKNNVFYCSNCQQRMQPVEPAVVESTLSQPEKVAQKLGSVKFQGWKCPKCNPQILGSNFHRVACISHSQQFSECPTCQELTVTVTHKTLKHPTNYRTGKRLIIHRCQCCNYSREKEEIIPRLPPPSNNSGGGHSSGGNYSAGGYSGGGSFGGDSGGGSFGGGGSDGGGAGGGW